MADYLDAERSGAIRIMRKLTAAVMDDPVDGLQAVFIANREALLRFLHARGAVEDAEDVLQDVWLKLLRSPPGPVAAPMSYLYRAANSVMIDRYRSAKQARLRENHWMESSSGPAPGVSDSPSAERLIAGRQFARKVEEVLGELPGRAVNIFRRNRLDGMTQRAIAKEFGVGVSTVESDLRTVYRVLAELKERLDEE